MEYEGAERIKIRKELDSYPGVNSLPVSSSKRRKYSKVYESLADLPVSVVAVRQAKQ